MKILGFTKSTNKLKKYDAFLDDNGKTVKVSFGDTRYQHFRDTALGLYKELDHMDLRRKRLFLIRHDKHINKKYSPAWFAKRFLWS